MVEAEEADADLPCTSPALVAPRDTQPAAAALVGAPEDAEQHVSITAQAQEVAKTAAFAASGTQVAAAESRAVAPHSPLPSQQEDLGQWGGSAAWALLKELGGKDRHWSNTCQDGSYGEESLSESGSYDLNKMESYSGPGKRLKLFLQDTNQSVSHGEDSKAQECCQKKNDISIRTIWVSPLNPELMVEAEEADADLPCTSPAPAAPMLQVATVESRALAPHSPCCAPSPLPSQQEDLGQWAGSAARALLEELWGEEGSCCEELRSGPSPECAEHTDLSRSAEEESTSGSLQSEPRPEDTEPSRMTREESSLVSLPREAWTADQDLSQSSEELLRAVESQKRAKAFSSPG
ncbi:hypothetical protein DUI87_14589 [Hirundo rustica rustica]|uniref:Uncharacterized protein n=1 Tax=Hirundo rustica rustica TaxID=333673 RepID=A0A3M0KMA4_HIRRU|nr:hypothetical protein DUI87_14589 [Hirundo rustica rustica]